ncbi:uncharacterized protein LOC109823210 [Asparagus officinalis]|uniref:uncharacterized protein LOC109823210 n=1 Tax=Asparagus officinalis TaxID=4686 RepID=UPI00098E0F0A|nr:uncharacterized protein LOC109823210 [Asparagus officinalis]
MTPGIPQMPTGDGPTGPAAWADTLMTLGIPAASEDGGIAGPAVGPDTTTVPGAENLHRSDVSPSLPSDMSNPPAGVDIPSSAAVSEPVGSQPEGTSVGIGSRSSLYERVRVLLVLENQEKNYKIIRSLTSTWEPKATTIEEANDLTTLTLDGLTGKLKVHEKKIKEKEEESQRTNEEPSQKMKTITCSKE